MLSRHLGGGCPGKNICGVGLGKILWGIFQGGIVNRATELTYTDNRQTTFERLSHCSMLVRRLL